MPKILSLCTSAGLFDKVFTDAGYDIIPGCEIVDYKRQMYYTFCQNKKHLCYDIKDLPEIVKGQVYDGVIGGIPCQSRSILKSTNMPKFPDLLPETLAVLSAISYSWAIFENVRPLDIPGFVSFKMDAMNYGQPHQSRPRHFTVSPGLTRCPEIFKGTVDSLLAYPGVYGRLYGPKRGAVLQGFSSFSTLAFPCPQLQEALADGVPRCLSEAWLCSVKDWEKRQNMVECGTKSENQTSQEK